MKNKVETKYIEKCLMDESYRYEDITEQTIKFSYKEKKICNVVLNILILRFIYKLDGEKIVFKLEINYNVVNNYKQRTTEGIILKFEQFHHIKQMENEIKDLKKKLNFAKAHFIHY